MNSEQSGSIFKRFGDMMGSLKQENTVEQTKYEGEPLFTVEDIQNASDPLVRMFRSLCVTENITVEYFAERYKHYVVTVLGKSPQSASNNKVNIMKMLQLDKISWKKFNELVGLVLGYDTSEIYMTFKKANRKEIKIKI